MAPHAVHLSSASRRSSGWMLATMVALPLLLMGCDRRTEPAVPATPPATPPAETTPPPATTVPAPPLTPASAASQ